ncbi:MAG: hypothetical protein ACOH1V_15245 [Stenotrophomonas sp.]
MEILEHIPGTGIHQRYGNRPGPPLTSAPIGMNPWRPLTSRPPLRPPLFPLLCPATAPLSAAMEVGLEAFRAHHHPNTNVRAKTPPISGWPQKISLLWTPFCKPNHSCGATRD